MENLEQISFSILLEILSNYQYFASDIQSLGFSFEISL